MYLGDVAQIVISHWGDVYYLLTNGMLRAFNYVTKKFIMETSVAYLFLHTNFAENSDPAQNNNKTIDSNPFS